MELGVALSSEELSARAIVRAAAFAEEVGFRTAWVSDHFHPWIDAQGESPFVWSVLGAIANATESIRVGTGVTCPIMRVHPAILAQATATTQCLFDGRFWFGVGTGEALNEHIVALKWPETSVRLAMLEEAVALIRTLWRGENVSHYGEYFQVENARIYSLPDQAPPIYVSAFGEKSAEVAARIGEGLVSTKPDDTIIRAFERAGGSGPKLAQVKVVWARKQSEAEDLAFERWPTSGLEGELSQELPTPKHFEQAASPLHKEDVVKSFACGPDPERHLESIQKYVDAGYDQIYVTQVGPDQEGFLRFYEREILPRFAGSERVGAGASANA
ncbi:MAG TPA: TIGR03557 family F420-dependent LLM class oxidoreductase [Acidimicrobiia bacterium]|jgi:G6PDH family F420-dependent oxidoreductase|nr:TIGR03557 family F420-dependent LLM class oxidoreductase [Acidimicrobiia bacterium]